MDLGISGKNALVCGASKGLGRACAEALAKEGVNVTLVARTAAALEATANEIRQLAGAQVTVTVVAADITTPEGRKQALAACPHADRTHTRIGRWHDGPRFWSHHQHHLQCSQSTDRYSGSLEWCARRTDRFHRRSLAYDGAQERHH